jgi:beta-glucosidase
MLTLILAPLTGGAQPPEDACAPVARTDDKGRFARLHAGFLERAKAGPVGILFLGDSITYNWSTAGETWQKHYGKYDPANFGIPGDRTQQILWRIEHGELDEISPRVVVLMIGTNNLMMHGAPEVAAGIRLIVRRTREKLPDARILILGIFPRGPRPAPGGGWDDGVEPMRRIQAINREVAALDGGTGGMVRFLDIGKTFLDADGKIPRDIMPDQLHLSPKGYDLWARAMEPLLAEMRGDASSQTTAAATSFSAPSRLVRNLRAGKKQTIVAYGTSLTAGGLWLTAIKELLDREFPGQVTIFNGAENGRESQWGLAQLDQRVLARKPDCVFIEFSINDSVARFHFTPEESRKNITGMIDRIRRARPECEIILQITNPVVGKPKGHFSHRANQTVYEQIYRDLSREHGLLLIDNAPAWQRLLTKEGEAGYQKLVPDGVHPSDAGWRQIVVPNIIGTLGLVD